MDQDMVPDEFPIYRITAEIIKEYLKEEFPTTFRKSKWRQVQDSFIAEMRR
jgi:hypothetical protein